MLYILNTEFNADVDHNTRDPTESAEKEVHGVYPGEGHEAQHAQAHGNHEEGFSFHPHQERYGPFHELHGQFFDGHSRLEHQEMYRNNGGINEHANMNSVAGAGVGDLRSAVLMAGYGDGIGHAYGAGIGGFCKSAESHGFGGFHHGDGAACGGGVGWGGGWGGAAGCTGPGCPGGGWGGAAGGAAGWGGGAGCTGPGCPDGGWGGAVGWRGAGWGGGAAGWGGGAAGWGGGAAGWGGAGWGGNAAVNGSGCVNGPDGFGFGNHAAFGSNGLLTPAHGELSVGGAYHTVSDSCGNANVRFFSGPEHAMFHDMLGHGVPANIVDFYNDSGAVDPATGEFVGGYMHGDSFKGFSRQSHKALELARNMATGNGFRRVLIGENAFGRMHGHYGQGGKPFAGAPAHSAIVGAAEGILTGFNGATASDMAYQQAMARKSLLMQAGSTPLMFFEQFENWMLTNRSALPNNSFTAINLQEQFRRWEESHRRALTQANLNRDTLADQYRQWIIDGKSALALASGKARILARQFLDRNNSDLHFAAAEYDLTQGNLARANMHVRKGLLLNAHNSAVNVERSAVNHLLRARDASLRGDTVTANALVSSAGCLLRTGRMTMEGVSASLGIKNVHHGKSIFPEGEMHAERARQHALRAEVLRREASASASEGNIAEANTISANASTEAAIGRAESNFGQRHAMSGMENKITTKMESFDNVADTGVKAAIAIQDNMNKISRGNDANFNPSVKEALEDMALKERSGANNAASKVAGDLLGNREEGKVIADIALNEMINDRMRLPPIKEAFIISNACEIARNLVVKEAANVRRERIEKAHEELVHDIVVRKRMNPQDTLGIIGVIDQDAASYIIVNGRLRLPLHGFDYKAASSETERRALEAQYRLRDDLRGKITQRLFDSPLNVIQIEGGFVNLPESSTGIEIEEGRAYISESGKARMEHTGIDTSRLQHRINTGERRDMATGMGYYVVDLSNMKIDLPSPSNPGTSIVGVKAGIIVDISLAEGMDIRKGVLKMIPWGIYLKTLRPKVNKAIHMRKPDKSFIENVKKGRIIAEKVHKVIAEDKKMLNEIATADKKLIVNPDGKAYIEVKPAYGVTERIKLETAKNLITSRAFNKGQLKFGQNAVDELRGESEAQCVRKKALGSQQDVARVSLQSAAEDKRTRFVINPVNAFNRERSIIKEIYKDNDHKILPIKDLMPIIPGIPLKFDRETAFEKGRIVRERQNSIKTYQEEQEEDEARGKYVHEINACIFKRTVGDIRVMSDERLIKAIELYFRTSLESLHEFDFMFEGYNFFKSRKVFLDRVRRFGVDYFEWRNIVRKLLKTNIKILHDTNLNNHRMFLLVAKLTDSMLTAIRNYLIIPVRASQGSKMRVVAAYRDAIFKLREIFENNSEIILAFIRNEILNIEHMDSTEGGTLDSKERVIFLPSQVNVLNRRIKTDKGVLSMKVKSFNALRPVKAKLEHTIIARDSRGIRRKICTLNIECNNCDPRTVGGNEVAKENKSISEGKLRLVNNKKKLRRGGGLVVPSGKLSVSRVAAGDIMAGDISLGRVKEVRGMEGGSINNSLSCDSNVKMEKGRNGQVILKSGGGAITLSSNVGGKIFNKELKTTAGKNVTLLKNLEC